MAKLSIEDKHHSIEVHEIYKGTVELRVKVSKGDEFSVELYKVDAELIIDHLKEQFGL